MADDFISPEYILSIGTGFSAAKTLLSAVELDVFTALARQPGSAADLEQRLGEGFIRIHRNALVATRAVRELRWHTGPDGAEGWAVRVAPIDEWLPVSRRQLAAVRDALGRVT